MKKVFAIICFCAVTLGAWGQNSVMDRVKEIRKAYSEALENIKSGQEDANQNNSASVIVNENWPGSGPCKFQVDFYFTSKFDDEGVFRGVTYILYAPKICGLRDLIRQSISLIQKAEI